MSKKLLVYKINNKNQFNFKKYNFTKNWFLNSEIKKNLNNHLRRNSKNNILEIGCFEGLSSSFFSDLYLDNIDSTLTCIDPFYESNSVENITTQFVNSDVLKRFESNIKKSKNYDKITFEQTTSDIFFSNNNKKFNFIYIDGNHEPDFIKRDIENSCKCLEKNGIIWMDDYGGKLSNNFDKILEDLKEIYNFKIIHKKYQLAIKLF